MLWMAGDSYQNFVLRGSLRFSMASLSTSPSQFSEDMTWDSLKRAIAASSGFKRWHLEQSASSVQMQSMSQEQLVSSYLRETLETLAY
jgi:hypothetical protein